VRGEQNDRNSKPHAVARLRIMAQRAEPVQQCLRDLGEHAGMRIARRHQHNDIDRLRRAVRDGTQQRSGDNHGMAAY
jgi:hypothetical protein